MPNSAGGISTRRSPNVSNVDATNAWAMMDGVRDDAPQARESSVSKLASQRTARPICSWKMAGRESDVSLGTIRCESDSGKLTRWASVLRE